VVGQGAGTLRVIAFGSAFLFAVDSFYGGVHVHLEAWLSANIVFFQSARHVSR